MCGGDFINSNLLSLRGNSFTQNMIYNLLFKLYASEFSCFHLNDVVKALLQKIAILFIKDAIPKRYVK